LGFVLQSGKQEGLGMNRLLGGTQEVKHPFCNSLSGTQRTRLLQRTIIKKSLEKFRMMLPVQVKYKSESIFFA
jgi:hypothetical protein